MEDFVLQFLDRCFLLIESSSLENTRLEQDSDKRSKLESVAEGVIALTCFSILKQTSLPIFNVSFIYGITLPVMQNIFYFNLDNFCYLMVGLDDVILSCRF